MIPHFSHLLSPGHIGTLEIRNRIAMPAMGTDLSGERGVAGERIRAYYEARARGGVGLITTEAVPIAFPSGFSRPHAMALQNDEQRAAMRLLTEAVHRHGAKLALQLNHHGPMAKRDLLAGRPLLVPSEPIPRKGDAGAHFIPSEEEQLQPQRAATPPASYRVLTIGDIAELTALYGQAARAAREAGADAIELHAAHGFLLSSFLSPRTNRREDPYGGSTEGRARFLIEVLTEVRRAVGADFPVWCKIDSEEYLVAGGITLADAKVIARLAEAAGAAAIVASTTADPANALALTESNIPDQPQRMFPNAAAIRSGLQIPVIASGRIEPDEADRAIARGEVDFVGFGRKLLADAELAAKLAAGRASDVRPCVYCYACISQLTFDEPVKCAVNADTGHELTRAVQPTSKKLRVAVVGGGPAGMEAARRLCLAGHTVTLFEAGDCLGGTLRFAALAYVPNARLLQWLRRQVAGLPVDVRLGTRPTPDDLRVIGAELIVVATGAIRPPLPIPGAERPHVLSGDDLRSMLTDGGGGKARALPLAARLAIAAGRRFGLMRSSATIAAASRVWMPLARNIVIIGSELVGLELAEFLALRGRTVTVLDDQPKPGGGLYVVRRPRVLHELADLGVTLINNAREIAIGVADVSFYDARQMHRIPAGTVIVAKGARGDATAADLYRRAGFPVRQIGDGTGVGYIEGAMADAAELAAGL
ncbi:FAD-dependent oxidoreductase [Corticibacterium sp. UT-5YL-CI-8]|nr:FAD-dependent oxidoreductase [Tianweitania sp. UT-5YL-CI-8]